MAATSPLPAQPLNVDDQEVIAANIRALMGRHRINEKALAEAIGMDYSGLCRRLAGKINISVRELGLIARYFGKDMVDLVTVGKLAVVQGGRSSDTDDPQQKLPFLRSLP